MLQILYTASYLFKNFIKFLLLIEIFRSNYKDFYTFRGIKKKMWMFSHKSVLVECHTNPYFKLHTVRIEIFSWSQSVHRCFRRTLDTLIQLVLLVFCTAWLNFIENKQGGRKGRRYVWITVVLYICHCIYYH